MRRINPHQFQIATRGTSREINRQIALNLLHTHQPISRADLARLMGLRRGAVSLIINELLKDGAIFEGMTGEVRRGRKPTFLYIDSRGRSIVGVDIRVTRTYIMVTDRLCRPLVGPINFPTNHNPEKLVAELSKRIKQILADHSEVGDCDGVGVVVPGMVDQRTGRVLNAPTLGWRGVDIRDRLAAATGSPVQVENSGRACSLAQLWLERGEATGPNSFVYLSISDGVGVGLVTNGELVRGHDHIAGEFGHMPLNLDGPRCMCGASGCWEAYISNLATLSRYFGWNLSKLNPNSLRDAEHSSFTVLDLIARARGDDAKATAAIQTTARFLGIGLGTIVNIVNPDCIYLAGEITAAWDLIEGTVREALAERALTESAARTPLRVNSAQESPRLRGAAALIAAP